MLYTTISIDFNSQIFIPLMLRSRVGSRKFWKGRSLSRIFNLRLRSPDTGTCVFSRTPPVCKNSSTVYVLDPSSLSLNHSGDSHTDVSNGPIQNLMGYSPDLRKRSRSLDHIPTYHFWRLKKLESNTSIDWIQTNHHPNAKKTLQTICRAC